jgi:hypothetical protein
MTKQLGKQFKDKREKYLSDGAIKYQDYKIMLVERSGE